MEGAKWRSVEHFYQAAKHEDAAVVKRIIEAATGLAARKAGQDRSLVARADWEDVKMGVMRTALEAKFSQNRKLREMLAKTGNEELVHDSESDRVWGRNRDGVGENLLGVMLMEARAGLKS